MKNVPYKLFVLTALIIIFTACTPTPKHSTRVGRGSNTRNSGTNLNPTGSGQVNSAGIAGFFSNYSNSNGTVFQLPCSVSQLQIGAQTDAIISLSSGAMFSGADSNNAALQLDFVLSCMGQNTDGSTFNDVRVSMSAGSDGFAGAFSQQAGSNVNVTFEDDMGAITLVGSISGQTYSGNIWYQNYWQIMSDGSEQSPGASNSLGSFSMPACGIFQCTN